MDYFSGVVAALLCFGMAVTFGFTRDRSFSATLLIVIATYYILFAAMTDSPRAVAVESVFAVVFICIALAGFRISPWFVIGGLAAHAVFDLLHHHLVTNPGVPIWWPGFCSMFDLVAAACFARLLCMRPRPR